MNDYSLFTLKKNGDFIALVVYVDDIIITGRSPSLITEVKSFIHGKFKIKDLGLLKYFLGLEVARTNEGIFLHQRKYALELLEEYGFLDCKPALTPIEQKHDLGSSSAPAVSDVLYYRRLIGKLLYLTVTRPDIAYTIHVLSQFVNQPTDDHLRAAHRVLRYLKAAPAQGIFFSYAASLELQVCCDADWAACPVTRKSITGYLILLGNSVVSWKSKKQQVVSSSSAESEHRSMAAACRETIWITRLFDDLQAKISQPIRFMCDNKATIHIAHNPVFHERTKHVEIDCHIVRSNVTSGLITLIHVGTDEQPADLLTKPLPKHRITYLCSKLGISNFLHAAA